jgi:hypothetical protein
MCKAEEKCREHRDERPQLELFVDLCYLSTSGTFAPLGCSKINWSMLGA